MAQITVNKRTNGNYDIILILEDYGGIEHSFSNIKEINVTETIQQCAEILEKAKTESGEYEVCI